MSDVDFVLHAIPRIADLLRVRSWDRGRGRGQVTEHQIRLLRQLDHTDPVMVGELAEYLKVTPSTMSLNLKRLEEAGLVTRSRAPEDRRAMNVLLTAEGTALRDSVPALDPARIDTLLNRMRPDDRERAMTGLSLLAEAATRLDADHARYVRALAGGRTEV
ncbi:MAG: MarR family transcriptional regulator [Longimicrobiales bacterium]|nr:MarR family transcriptional regulator [Longimicrobiales bacterium]